MKHSFAILSAVLAGVTESCLYFFFKLRGKEEGTFKGMFELYGGSFTWIAALVALSQQVPMNLEKIDLSWKVWAPMLLFNGLVGFGGYAMRFAAIPMVSTLVFSLLSFFGIVAAFVFGYLFEGENPSWTAMLGSAAIILANGVLLSKV
jgi:drug/metabolite transporter (DMT)-like permease